MAIGVASEPVGVIDVSTQLSYQEWGDTFDIAMKLATVAERVAFRSAS